MGTFLVKIFAVLLTLSQVTTAPDAIKTQFDRTRDQEQVAGLLRAGCMHMRKLFDVEGINLDDLISTAFDDPQASAPENLLFRGINFRDFEAAYRRFCSDKEIVLQAVDLSEVIDFYNKAAADLPDHAKLKGLRLPGASILLDSAGQPFAELFEENKRRAWVPLADIPTHLQAAFIAAEDRRFYQHQGIDERALIRAFVGNLAQAGRPQGGSTITQQLVKNLLVGDDLSYERKIREMIVAARVERTLSKAEILELYLNSVYLGRGAWGVEMGARAYFGKAVNKLILEEGALLASLVKGPNYFNPDRHPARAKERLAYVYKRMQEDGLLPTAQPSQGLPALVAHERSRRDVGFYFVDQVAREIKSVAGMEVDTAAPSTVRSTIDLRLQRAVDDALQEGLSHYERIAGRAQFKGPEANLAKAVEFAQADPTTEDKRPAWQRALASARLPLYDVHWTPAVVLPRTAKKQTLAVTVGLADGRVVPFAIDVATTEHKIAPYDVVLVRMAEGKGKGARAELRVRPEVQGAAVVLENKTGRILAMSGGFSHALSQLNRVTQAIRQPGSAIKPLSYLAALGKGAQPNTLVMDTSLALPPIGSENYWRPKNYDGRSGGVLTLRRALEKSRNLATVRLLSGGIEKKPEDSLNRLCDLAVEAQIYRECLRLYPFVLGAQPVRPIDLAAFYAAIANEGLRPTPHVVESIERDGEVIYRHQQTASPIESIDKPAFYQLKSMLQGVVARGTASGIADLAPYVAGKTGTSDDENDAWFVGFTNEVTVAVWIGYDNADGKRHTLGGGATGGAIAVPIFEPIIQAVWANAQAKTELAPPSADAYRQFACKSAGRRKALSECLRVNAKGKPINTRYVLLSGKGLDQEGEIKPDGDYLTAKRNDEENKRNGQADLSQKRADGEGNAAVANQEKHAGALLPSVASSLSMSKPDADRLRAVEELMKAADERIRKLMQICRGC